MACAKYRPAALTQRNAMWSGNQHFTFEGVDFVVNEIPALAG
jgi:hypothetical protein